MSTKKRSKPSGGLAQPEDRAQAFRQARESRRNELFEDYVELIDDLVREKGEARQVDIAAHLGVTQPTVARTLSRLAEAGLVDRQPYRGVFLSPEGVQMAEQGRRRHDIVENFLVDIGIDRETARIDAEGIEHHVSDETLAAFEAFSKRTKRD